jgi:hypothetical protein
MWPWEHVAVAYIAYSLLSRTAVARRPGPAETLAVVLGALAPDLIDKPLAWLFGVLSSGYGVGHSVFVAVPLAIAAVVAGAALDRRSVGTAFGVAYLSHLPADVYYGVLLGNDPAYSAVTWPLGASGAPSTRGLLENVAYYFEHFLEFLATPEAKLYIGAELTLLTVAAVLLYLDGREHWRTRSTVGARGSR